MQIEIHLDPDSKDQFSETEEGNSPHHQFSLKSFIDITKKLKLDLLLRYVDNLPNQNIPNYTTMDAQISYKIMKNFEFSIVGQNLFDDLHPEFSPEITVLSPSGSEIERSIYAKLTWEL